jgi:hypothetical protein
MRRKQRTTLKQERRMHGGGPEKNQQCPVGKEQRKLKPIG